MSVNRKLVSSQLLIFILAAALPGCATVSRLFDKGGTVFVVEVVADDPNQTDIVDRTINVTRSRINAVGLDGDVRKIADTDNQIEIKLYGTNDLVVMRKFLFTTYRLELKKVISPPSPSPLKVYPTRENAEQMAEANGQVLPYSVDGEEIQFIIVEKTPIITGEQVRHAQAVSPTGLDSDYQISFSLKADGSKTFGDWTGRNIGNYIAVVLNGEVQSVAYIKSQIFDQGEISGRFTEQSAKDIALSLSSGYLTATLRIIDERQFK